MTVEILRVILDKFIDTSKLSDMEILKIYETEMIKRHSFLDAQ